ncbi:efflux RND transporter permease subunit [Pseudomarimonas salicorniae]|uniref:CusA/CzcA family heavy metal efflux RND transporter n=1 Tax=Pseudomarimonas salicorniae TaxID=2933270 RepID=A0ABT0GEQ9_9GAMM|nr:CusA/CzcA family heavy metal efflux RND transporter [Lysobacter sp. CAU 1642]MCK7592512.1 CusA/CzcA family heavy metal efflux RND transporter [Lysobacter sp. CAU 1642]
MIAALIRASLAHRGLVLLLSLLLTLAAIHAARTLPVDAIPDLSDVQVTVRTEWPGQSPQLVEDQLTYPLASRLLAVPGARHVRGFSMTGDSFVYVLFEDGTDPYWARSRVLEYLSQARSELPAGVEPALGPDATGVGWVYQYALVDRSGGHDLSELRALQDWFLKLELQALPGVSEVATVGGMERQYQAIIDPLRLRQYGLRLDEVSARIRAAGAERGGSLIEVAEGEISLRGIGFLRELQDLAEVPLGVLRDGVPVLLGDVADIRFGAGPRQGIAELDGEGEVVGGVVVMRDGGNAREVIAAVEARLAALKESLPEGVELITVYDRSALIDRAVSHLSTKLVEEILVVGLVCLLFLGHFRSALVPALLLPLGVLLALAIMRVQGINAHIMSLGGIAIAIGAMVDAAIVLVENAHKQIEHFRQREGREPREPERLGLVTDAAIEVGPAVFVSLLIIALSFLPVFLLESQEGRMFSPLAWTKTWAMLAAALLAVTLGPVLMALLVRGRIRGEHEQPLSRLLIALYRPVLRGVLRFPRLTVLITVLLAASALWPLRQLGSEFMPQLEEGDLMYMPTTLPELSPGKAQQLLQQTSRLIRETPEVARVFGKIGRADSATDPAPLSMIETTIQLKPQDQWREGLSMDDLVAELDARLRIPGLTNAWVQPIRTRIDMQATGLRTPLGVRLAGDDLDTLTAVATEVEAALAGVPGIRSAYADRGAQARSLEVRPRREALARYGVEMDAFMAWLGEAVGGAPIATAYEGRRRFPVALRLPQSVRDSPEALAELGVVTPSGQQVPLGRLADIELVRAPAMIRSEDARLTAWVFVDTDTRDLLGTMRAAEAALREKVSLPSGVSLGWAGQFEALSRATERLSLALPAVLGIILVLLYVVFRRWPDALIVLLTAPLSVVGGIWLLWALDYALSVAVVVGFLALFGVAAEFGVVMLIYLAQAVRRAREAGQLHSRAQLDAALEEGAVLRVRPKAMTVLTLLAGLTPILLSEGTGAATMQRIAAPMLGGMLSAPLLSLLLIPAIYRWWLGRQLDRNAAGSSPN